MNTAEPGDGNPFTVFDYASYYDGDNATPCEYVDTRAFSRVYLATLYSLVFILGFMGNGLVVWVILKHRHKTNMTDMCLLNLAISDLLFVLTLPFSSHYIIKGTWIFGDFMCRFLSCSHVSGFFSSIFFMVVMTLDRYIIIMHSHRAVQYRTMRAGFAVSVVVWMLSMCVSLPSLLFSKVENVSHAAECNNSPELEHWNRYNIFSKTVLGLLIPLLAMIVCYSRVIPTLMKMKSAKKHRVVKLIVFIVVIFFLFWAPYNISLVLSYLQRIEIIPQSCIWDNNLRLSITVTEAFAYTHCCLNPIIYAFVGQKFMKRAMQLLKRSMPFTSRLSESSFRRSSVSRSSDAVPTVLL
ncbi:C-C chemokine receptor type 1-like [Menidia menidia]